MALGEGEASVDREISWRPVWNHGRQARTGRQMGDKPDITRAENREWSGRQLGDKCEIMRTRALKASRVHWETSGRRQVETGGRAMWNHCLPLVCTCLPLLSQHALDAQGALLRMISHLSTLYIQIIQCALGDRCGTSGRQAWNHGGREWVYTVGDNSETSAKSCGPNHTPLKAYWDTSGRQVEIGGRSLKSRAQQNPECNLRELLLDTLAGQYLLDNLSWHSCGTLLLDILAGHSFLTLLLDTPAGHSWHTWQEDTLALTLLDTVTGHLLDTHGHSCLTLLLDTLALTLLRDSLVRTLLLDTLGRHDQTCFQLAFSTKLSPKVTIQASKRSIFHETFTKSDNPSFQNERFTRDFYTRLLEKANFGANNQHRKSRCNSAVQHLYNTTLKPTQTSHFHENLRLCSEITFFNLQVYNVLRQPQKMTFVAFLKTSKTVTFPAFGMILTTSTLTHFLQNFTWDLSQKRSSSSHLATANQIGRNVKRVERFARDCI